MLRTFGKGIAILIGLLVTFFVGLFITLCIFNSPTYAWRLLRYGRSDIHDYKIFPERAITNGSAYFLIPRGRQGAPYEVEYEYQDATRTEVLEDLLRRTGTRSFLIIKDDQLIYETYLGSLERKSTHPSLLRNRSIQP